MAQIRRSGPDVIQTATAATTTVRCVNFNCCATKGCPWRGTCPVHTAVYPRGFAGTFAMMRGRHNG